jgi:hypothetical protein
MKVLAGAAENGCLGGGKRKKISPGGGVRTVMGVEVTKGS